jgi:DNA-binding response OmpR family regulator
MSGNSTEAFAMRTESRVGTRPAHDGGPPGGLAGEPVTRQVLVVSNGTDQAEALAADLRRHGYEVLIAPTGADALRSHADADLVLLELELADLDGLDVCRAIRAWSDVPVIAVTSRVGEVDRVLGLQAGADDCIVKPYGFRELLARMEAVLRRAGVRPARLRTIQHGGLCIDASARRVVLDGRLVEMTRKEFDLLHVLAANPNTVLSHKRLMREVWGGSFSRRTIDTHVSALRNKLGANNWIITVRGVGYRIGHA